MAASKSSRLPFLIVSHEAVVVRAEEWLVMNGDVKHGDNFDSRAGESSGSGERHHAANNNNNNNNSPPDAGDQGDIEMESQSSSLPSSLGHLHHDQLVGSSSGGDHHLIGLEQEGQESADDRAAGDHGGNHGLHHGMLSRLLEEALCSFKVQYELYLQTAEALSVLCEHKSDGTFPQSLTDEAVVVLGVKQTLAQSAGRAKQILRDYKNGVLDVLIKARQSEIEYYMDCLASAPADLEEKVSGCFPSVMSTELLDEADKTLVDDMLFQRRERINRVVDEFSDKALLVQIQVAAMFPDGRICTVASLLNKRREEERVALMPMHERVWGGLPEDLIDRTLACLPVPSFFRFRAVCKRWNFLMHSDTFLELWSKVSSQRLWLYSIHVRHATAMVAMAYNPSLGIWHNVPVPQYASKMYTLASAGGLLCSAAYPNRLAVVCVCNPLTSTWKDLPSMLYIKRVHLLGMVVDRITKSYKIVVVGTQSRQDLVSNTEVYDSRVGSWEITGRALGSFTSHRLVYCNGMFYNLSATRGWPVTLILHAYDIEQEVWREEIRAAMLLNFQAPPSLVECQGSLLIVGRISEDSHFAKPKAIRLWELRERETGGEWMEVVTMPPALLEEFCKEWQRPTHFRCRGLGNVIYFLSSRALMYDLSQKVWQWLPTGPGYHYDHVLPFEPRLDVIN